MSSLFVGSATEDLEVAYDVQLNLRHDAHTQVWTQGLFRPTRTTLEVLLEAAQTFDFAVFVFTPKDIAKIRGRRYMIVRDNVMFELGIFLGNLGRERCFIFVPRGASKEFHLPTDLVGVTPVEYNAKRPDLTAAVGEACHPIRKEIKRLGLRTVSSRSSISVLMRKVEEFEREITILTFGKPPIQRGRGRQRGPRKAQKVRIIPFT